MTTINEWVKENVEPNVIGVHRIDKVSSSGVVTQYDVHVLVKTAEGTNITTQPVNEFNGEFNFGNRVVKNFVPVEQEINKEKKIKEALNLIKQQDPNASYIGIDTSNDLTVVKLKVGGEVKGFSLLDGELIALNVE